MPQFRIGQHTFRYRDTQTGEVPFLFQHGLGGNLEQPFGIVFPNPRIRLLTMDSRGHGPVSSVGSVTELSFATLADDLIGLMEEVGLQRAIVGGISMGAGVALNFGLRYPERVDALVLSRPAWLDQPHPPNLRLLDTVARLLMEKGSEAGVAEFVHTGEYRRLIAEAPDCARSLVHQFRRERAVENVEVLRRLPADMPITSLADLTRIQVPTLILGNDTDPQHPLEYAESLAAAIPGALFRQITSKSIDPEKHIADFNASLARFARSLRV
jgi:pimeloyl-ACP methyl ester carboxylesterase